MYQLYHRFNPACPWEFAFTYETMEAALHFIAVASNTPICFHAREWGVFLSDGTEAIQLNRVGRPHLEIHSLPQWIQDRSFARLDQDYDAKNSFYDKMF